MTQFITRAYNSFELDTRTKSILIKKSSNPKLSDEIDYYLNLPRELSIFFPRYFGHSFSEEKYQLSLEYYGYSNLGLKMIDENFNDSQWKSIFNFIFNYIDNYKQVTTIDSNNTDYIEMYVGKTEKEYKNLINNFQFFNELSQYDILVLNGKNLLSFDIIWPKIKSHIIEKFIPENYSYIHGDFCFSNILFAENKINDDIILKFIDPRGSYGSTKYYGDFYYDLAKLSHSCNGGYEYFINDKFHISINKYIIRFGYDFTNKSLINELFLQFIRNQGLDELKIKTLEGIIFIGMCARHYDNIERQKAMYITGLKILNEVYEQI